MRLEWLALIMLLFELIQSTWLQVPAFSWIEINLCFVLLLYIACFRGPLAGLLFGLATGLVIDITSATFIGGETFTLGVIGYFAGAFFSLFLNQYLLLFTITVMVLTVIQVVMGFGIHVLFTTHSIVDQFTTSELYPVVSISVRHAIFNGFFTLFTYPFAEKWISKKKKQVVEEDA